MRRFLLDDYMSLTFFILLLSALLFLNLEFPTFQRPASSFSEHFTNDRLNQTNSSSSVMSGFNNTLQKQTAICADVNNSICFNEVRRLPSIIT